MVSPPSTPGGHVRPQLPPPARVALDAAGWAIGTGFRGISRLRGGKAVHPDGVVHEGTLEVHGAAHAPPAALLRDPGRHPALIRFSRSLGLPRPLVDLLGIAFRLPDVHGPGRHQDFLCVTSVDAPVLHHLFVPARDFQARPYTTSLLYRPEDGGEDAGAFLVGLRPVPGSPRGEGDTEFERLASAAGTGRLRFELCTAPVWGRFAPVATLHVGGRRPDDEIRFDPWNTGGGLRPDGVLNLLRDYAYPLSQAGWDGQ